MAELSIRESLQPALLDRLTDDAPSTQKPEPRESRVINRKRLREAVLRDLRWLFNATRLARNEDLSGLTYVPKSVLNFGLPALAGETASSLDVVHLVNSVREAIERYEPRIRASTLEVEAIELEADGHRSNVVHVQIRGELWGHPSPVRLLLQTDVDLETGEVDVRDLDQGGSR